MIPYIYAKKYFFRKNTISRDTHTHTHPYIHLMIGIRTHKVKNTFRGDLKKKQREYVSFTQDDNTTLCDIIIMLFNTS